MVAHLILEFQMCDSASPLICEFLDSRHSCHFKFKFYTYCLPLYVQHIIVALRMRKLLTKSLHISGKANMQTYQYLLLRRVLQKVSSGIKKEMMTSSWRGEKSFSEVETLLLRFEG